jgi:hypothetical protein
LVNFTWKKWKFPIFSNFLFDQELKICPPKKSLLTLREKTHYIFEFFPFKNSKSSTTNYYFKLGEFFGICMYIHIHITFTWNYFWRNWIFSRDVARVFYMVKLILASSLNKCENLYNKSNGVLYLMYLFIWVIQTYILPFTSPLFSNMNFLVQ